MSKEKIFDTLYFTDTADKKSVSDLQNWITRNQPFNGPVIAKAFIGPEEKLPMYIEVDASASQSFFANLWWWGIRNGFIVEQVKDFDVVPLTVKSAGEAMARVRKHIAEVAVQN